MSKKHWLDGWSKGGPGSGRKPGGSGATVHPIPRSGVRPQHIEPRTPNDPKPAPKPASGRMTTPSRVPTVVPGNHGTSRPRNEDIIRVGDSMRKPKPKR